MVVAVTVTVRTIVVGPVGVRDRSRRWLAGDLAIVKTLGVAVVAGAHWLLRS